MEDGKADIVVGAFDFFDDLDFDVEVPFLHFFQYQVSESPLCRVFRGLARHT